MAATAMTPQVRRVLASSLLGNTVEYYEFFVYGLSSALVFNRLFFPSFDPFVGTLLSLSTFAVAFVARPIGGWIFGHFGDRLGRRAMLMITLIGMGGATTLIGLLPTYATIGVAAPVLLVLLRTLQGLSLGGEASGGFLMSLEHAAPGRRGFFTGIVGTGNVFGLLLANGVFLLVSRLPEAYFLAWGWRVPFLASALLVGVGLYIRLRIDESPEFEAAKSQGAVTRRPSAEVVRRFWPVMLGVSLSSTMVSITFYLGSVFSLGYGETIGVPHATILGIVIATCAVLVVAMPFFGWLSDRFERRRIFLAGLAVMTVSPFLWFPLLNTGRPLPMVVGFLLFFAGFAANYGVQNAFYPHLFPAHLRYSGTAISVNVGNLLGGALAPIVATSLLGTFHSWIAVAAYVAGMGVVALISASFLRERPDATALAGVPGAPTALAGATAGRRSAR